MTETTLQLVCVGTLLLLHDLASSRTFAADRTSRCDSDDQLDKRIADFYKLWNKTSISRTLAEGARSCAQARTEMRGDAHKRSVSPWKYYLDHDANRIPPKISFAECLCQGCLIGKSQNSAYNSVPVFGELMVLKKTPCSSDPKRFVLKKSFIKVPVACVCVVPNYAE